MNSKEKWWTSTRITRMLDLRHQGHSFASIARVLGTTTKNAVLSKYKRMVKSQLIPKQYAHPQVKILRKIHASTPTPAIGDIKPLANVVSSTDKQDAVRKMKYLYEKVAELNNLECKFPIGEISSPDFTFCFDPITGHRRSYCENHHALTHTPLRSR